MNPGDIRNDVNAAMETIRRSLSEEAYNAVLLELLRIVQPAAFNPESRKIAFDLLPRSINSEDVLILFYLAGFEKDGDFLLMNPSTPTEGLAVLFEVLQDTVQMSTIIETSTGTSVPIDEMPAEEAHIRSYNASESVESGDPLTVSAHLSFHFFMRWFLLATQSTRSVSSVLHSQAKVSMEAIEMASHTLGIMKQGSQSHRHWTDLKDVVMKVLGESASVPSTVVQDRARLASQMLSCANSILNDIKEECTPACASMFYYMHLTRAILMVTSSGRSVKRDDAQKYVTTTAEFPMNRFSDKYKQSVETVTKHCLKCHERELNSDEVIDVHAAVLWQSNEFLENFQSLPEPDPDSGLPRCPNAPTEPSQRRLDVSSFSHSPMPSLPSASSGVTVSGSSQSLERDRQAMRVQMQEFRSRAREGIGSGLHQDSNRLAEGDNRYGEEQQRAGELVEAVQESVDEEEKEEVKEKDDDSTEKEKQRADDDEKEEVDDDDDDKEEEEEEEQSSLRPTPPSTSEAQSPAPRTPQPISQSQPSSPPSRPGSRLDDPRRKALQAAEERRRKQIQEAPPSAGKATPKQGSSSPSQTKTSKESAVPIQVARMSKSTQPPSAAAKLPRSQPPSATVTPFGGQSAKSRPPSTSASKTPASKQPATSRPRGPATAPPAAAAAKPSTPATKPLERPLFSPLTPDAMSITVPSESSPPPVAASPAVAAASRPSPAARKPPSKPRGPSPLEGRFRKMTVENVPDLLAAIENEQDAEVAVGLLEELHSPARSKLDCAEKEFKELQLFMEKNRSDTVRKAVLPQFGSKQTQLEDLRADVARLDEAIKEATDTMRRSKRIELTEVDPKILVECIEETLEAIRDDHDKMVTLLRRWLPFAPRDVLVTICEKLAIEREGDDPKVWVEQIKKRDQEATEIQLSE